MTASSDDEQARTHVRALTRRSPLRFACALAAGPALAAFATIGCAGPPPPPPPDTSTIVIPPPASAAPPIASAAPPASIAPPPAPAPSAAASVDPMTCTPKSPPFRFDVVNDDVVKVFDAQGCPLGESHFKINGYGYQASVDFFTELQKRVKAGDKNGLAELANYPLRVNRGQKGPLIVKDRAAFLRSFDQIYTPRVVSALLAADVRDVFCKYQGVAVGDGVVWADNANDKGHYGIIAVNLPR